MLLYDAVVFDLDGTLTDSQEGIISATRYALEKMNAPIPKNAVLRKFLGPPLLTSFKTHCGPMKRRKPQQIIIANTMFPAAGKRIAFTKAFVRCCSSSKSKAPSFILPPQNRSASALRSLSILAWRSILTASPVR